MREVIKSLSRSEERKSEKASIKLNFAYGALDPTEIEIQRVKIAHFYEKKYTVFILWPSIKKNFACQ